MVRILILAALVVAVLVTVTAAVFGPWGWWIPAVIFILLLLVGIRDATQRRHAILRNFPVLGRARFFLEEIRPEIQQYFIERNWDGKPFNRDQRSLIYSRAKGFKGDKAFGTELNVNQPGYEYFVQSIAPKAAPEVEHRVRLGGPDCTQPYDASLLNISSMSFGSLSKNAVLAMNKGAAQGGFAQETGEGGLTKYHLQYGADLIWEFGSGYFGARTADGHFDPEKFREKSNTEQVKAVTIKLSQGAKPGLGGVLPGTKVTAEIAEARGVPEGETCISPASHSAFTTPRELVRFIAQLRELSNGKPIGFKLCIGSRVEILAICKAMIEEKITPDFIIVDGSEGGTGAAPLEYQDHVGTPLTEGVILLHNALVGSGLRDRIKIGAAGKVISGHDIVRHIIQGADFCMSARAMMMAVGCIQAQKCHTNKCPVGVATQDPRLYQALDVDSKGDRVERYHRLTVEETGQIIATMGCERPEQMTREMLRRRITATESISYESLYRWLGRGELFEGVEGGWGEDWDYASPDRFTAGHPGKYVYNDRTEFTGRGEAAAGRDMAMAGANQGSVSATARGRAAAPTRAAAQGTGQSNAGATNRPEGQPGTVSGAQHTVQDPGTSEDHVDPGDEDSVSPDVD
ncbi:FMN-binding glutamate synthase family protein [Kocuria sp. cx-455]|uniref:FMN-binding glutamate synthase family protein n=1 Tax=Kocuria sp. cx-455 TaxID=2771377 RepID=UPI00168A2C5E|nr:FMN-binding glutamate synthase family protein [Kocuria sp. cx-455]MBD2765100.1 FMN-binding glutamate synthase family protein [Kocuria sp. cx-455]